MQDVCLFVGGCVHMEGLARGHRRAYGARGLTRGPWVAQERARIGWGRSTTPSSGQTHPSHEKKYCKEKKEDTLSSPGSMPGSTSVVFPGHGQLTVPLGEVSATLRGVQAAPSALRGPLAVGALFLFRGSHTGH
ncbi:hypothetical protein CAAN1_08S00298 [[Candida] anglica]|uniref:Uncharacterized protein n=1 Tax=[Candida] anglica TaxID=148631 RepID=A0ABP0E6F9_9ASCO